MRRNHRMLRGIIYRAHRDTGRLASLDAAYARWPRSIPLNAYLLDRYKRATGLEDEPR